MTAHEEIKRICAIQNELVAEVGKDKWELRAAGQRRGADRRRPRLPRHRLPTRSTTPTRSCASKGTNELEPNCAQTSRSRPKGESAKYTLAQITERVRQPPQGDGSRRDPRQRHAAGWSHAD